MTGQRAVGALLDELLRAGLSDRAVARHAQVRTARVRAVRTALGLPRHKPGATAASSPEDLFWRRAQHTEDGHMVWPGADLRTGACIRHGGRRHSVHKVAFRIGTGREPVGKVTTGCSQVGCVHPSHVEDRPMRQQFTAIFGEVTP